MKIGIIFDLDGTLIDTIGLHVETFKKAAKDLGLKNIDQLTERFRHEIGKPLEDIVVSLFPNATQQLKEELKKRKWKYTMEEIKKVKPIRETLKCVKTLQSYPKGVFSSSIREFVEKSLEVIKARKYFEVIVSAEDARSKPDPEGLIKACKALSCDTCVYVGDRKVDELCAKNAGYEFVYVQQKPLIKEIGKAILLSKLKLLKKSNVKNLVNKRISQFEKIKGKKELFKELAFCLLTANYSAEGGIKIQKAIGDGFLTLNKKELEKNLRKLGHRYPKKRAEYIVEARKYIDKLPSLLRKTPQEAREWLVKNIRGLGYKEASHFLRNIGVKDLAIIDFHIIDLLEKHWIIKRPKTLTRKRYLEIENELRKIAKKAGITLAELDLYLWYMETGKVLK